MSKHVNMVRMGVTSIASAGEGTITLGAASSGFLHINVEITANDTVDIRISNAAGAFEVCRNCTFTYSATPSSCTITRGTLETGSNGASRVAFDTGGSGVTVDVVSTADSGRRWDSAALEHVAGTDADTTMAVGMMYVVDMSAWATADRTYTLPATAAVGSRIGIAVTAGDATHELIIKPGASDTINGGSAAAEWSRLFITGEVVILRCVTADSAWVVEYDGRIACAMSLLLTTQESGTKTLNTFYAPTALSGAWTADLNVGSCASTSASKFIARRAGAYLISGHTMPHVNIADAAHVTVEVTDGTTTHVTTRAFVALATSNVRVPYVGTAPSLAVDAYLQFTSAASVNSNYLGTSTRFNVLEQLP